METHLEAVGGAAVLELLGDSIDSSNADEVRRQLGALAAGHPRLVLDLNRVRFIDSTGCGALIDGQKRFRDAGGDLRLCRPTDQVRTVLELARLTRVLSVFDTREAALAGFEG